MRSTLAAKAPKLSAQATKSGLVRSVAITRPGYSRSWCMRIVPYIELFTTRMTGSIPWCTAVAISCPVISAPPSPQNATTGRSG